MKCNKINFLFSFNLFLTVIILTLCWGNNLKSYFIRQKKMKFNTK